MKIRETLRRTFRRAKERASDVARAADIRLEIRDLEGRRDHHFREIGRRVHAGPRQGRLLTEFDTISDEIRRIEERIREREAALRELRRSRHAAPAEEATATG